EGMCEATSNTAPQALPLLSAAETTHLVSELNDTSVAYPKDVCLHTLFEQQVAAYPDKVAVVFEAASLTYQQLNDKANQLAHYLIARHGVSPDTLVGLCVPRSLEMVIGILGILKAGGAYVPLDPSYPPERLSYMLDDAGLEVVLSHSDVAEVLCEFEGDVIALDGMAQGEEHCCASYPTAGLCPAEQGLTASHLAYVIYTSGSTGRPKGVMVEHGNAIAMISWALNSYTKNEISVVLASTSLNFDLSVYELFAPLSGGCKLRIVKNILDLASLDQADEITLINTVPSAMDALLKLGIGLKALKVINLAGEALKASLVNNLLAFYPGIAVCNLYGPSEDTTYSTAARFEKVLARAPHIGKVITNSIGLILNEAQQLVPYGVVGELYLGGDGVTRGYWNRPSLTAERFIDNPFYDENNPCSARRLYRTGDLVRYLPDGNIDFLGRADDQVKIRGFRIEIGEIETQLVLQTLVDSALVMAKELA
ncbi:amino acid adenylation domain-containing protein, partial [Pseudoalteromonas piscicida]|uniref:non-ribosomal peptide synthetase n=1 Tax=Pseudoalteromonas piscicida TaxID=43662 RepID=UPI002738B3B7